MNDEIVSIMIPCYNGEKTIARCLDSVLLQTYKKIQLVIVNDGSTDNSEKIILAYREKFLKEGMELVYISQDNQGLGGAINTALKYVTGDFLCWGDIDDFWLSESVDKRVQYLKSNTEYGSVSSDAWVYFEDDLDNPIEPISNAAIEQENPYQFKNFLSGIPLFCSGCHMIKMEIFKKSHPKMNIYPARHGQNVQLLLPVYYISKRGFIKQPLYGYVLYSDSMSHKEQSLEEKYKRGIEYIDILTQTVKNIPNMKQHDYHYACKIIKERKYRLDMDYAYSKHMYGEIIINIIKIVLIGGWKKKDTEYVMDVLFSRIKKKGFKNGFQD